MNVDRIKTLLLDNATKWTLSQSYWMNQAEEFVGYVDSLKERITELEEIILTIAKGNPKTWSNKEGFEALLSDQLAYTSCACSIEPILRAHLSTCVSYQLYINKLEVKNKALKDSCDFWNGLAKIKGEE